MSSFISWKSALTLHQTKDMVLINLPSINEEQIIWFHKNFVGRWSISNTTLLLEDMDDIQKFNKAFKKNIRTIKHGKTSSGNIAYMFK